MRETLLEIADALALHGAPADEAAAQSWLDAGFDDAEEVAEWLAARCLAPAAAQRLEEAGFTPAQAAQTDDSGGYMDTIGHKLTNGDLSFDEARRLVTSAFWGD